MKKIIILVFTIFVSVCSMERLSAIESYVVMDSESGRVLGSKNMDEKMLIASTTKIMTAIVALENAETTKLICAGDEISKVYGSMIYVDPGECMTLYDFLVGLMLRSGNDAAMVIAENTLGYDKFIDKMNETASRLGMKNTVFANPHGLDEDTKNYSTAYDMALLMRYATGNKVFMELDSLKKYTVSSNVETHLWHNKNKLLSNYKFATGGKIGYTTSSGHIFASSASKGRENLVVVTMKDEDQFKNHENFYESYFDSYDKFKVIDQYTFSIKEDYYKNYHLFVKEDVDIMLKDSELDKVSIDVELIKKKKVDDNDIVGKVSVSVDGNFVESINVYAIGQKGKLSKVKNWLFFWKR